MYTIVFLRFFMLLTKNALSNKYPTQKCFLISFSWILNRTFIVRFSPAGRQWDLHGPVSCVIQNRMISWHVPPCRPTACISSLSAGLCSQLLCSLLHKMKVKFKGGKKREEKPHCRGKQADPSYQLFMSNIFSGGPTGVQLNPQFKKKLKGFLSFGTEGLWCC